jgi:fibronectin type 3 domain-containing protein
MLTWTAASGATSYTVTRCETVDGTYTNIATGVNTAYHLDSTASPNTVYYYKIVAVNSAGSSAPSAEDHAKSPPAAPTGLAATAAGADIALNWTGSAGAVSYKVWRSTTEGGAYTEIASNVLDTTYTDAGLTAGSTFYYKVQAVNDEAKTGSLTSAVSGTTAPPAPTGLTATATSSTIQLGWSSAAGGNFLFHQKVQCRLRSLRCYRQKRTATNYTDSGLNAATTYRYKVQAENAAGLSPESEEKQATTLAE